MKKLFLIVTAMFAVVSFSACSDDDEGGGNPLTEMRYVKEIRSSQGEIESFEYDQQHRISKYGSCSRLSKVVIKGRVSLSSDTSTIISDAPPRLCAFG